MVEYPLTHPDHHDGVSEIKCLTCKKRYGRWSGKVLGRGETEKRFGDLSV